MSTLLAIAGTTGIIDTVLSLVGTLLYPLFSIIFLLIDGIQDIFYSFAGIGNAWHQGTPITAGNSGAENDTGILYYLMTRPLVKNMIYSMIMLALFLVIIFTVLAFIKNAYSAKPKNWKELIGNAIKGLANFVLLPVCCLLGVWFGNILLQAINGATSNGGSSTMSRKLFIAAAYNANIYRNANGDVDGAKEKIEGFLKVYDMEGMFVVEDGRDAEYYANLVDQIYSVSGQGLLEYGGWGTGVPLYSHTSVGPGITPGAGFYNLWQINYLVLIVGGIFMLYVLGSLAFAMVRRLFILLSLLIISPGVCALYPLDEGKAVQSWSGEVKKQVLSAYGAVAGMNIFFSILPLFDDLNYTAGFGGGGWGLSEIVYIFILVVGLQCVKELISMFSGFVGGEDAYAKGAGLMKSTTKEVAGRAGKLAVGTVGAFARAKAVKDATGHGFLRSLGGSAIGGLAGTGKNALKTITGGALDIDAMQKAAKEKRKEGLEHPNPRQERQVERYNERRSNAAFNTARPSAETAINTARTANRALTNDEMAGVLNGIRDKEAKRRVAGMLAEYNNRYNIANGGNTTTIEKVLESEDKVLQEASRRQDAYGANTDLTNKNRDLQTANSAIGSFETGSMTSRVNGNRTFAFNRSTGVITATEGGVSSTLSEHSAGELETLRLAAEAGQAGAQESYAKALENNELIEKYKKLLDKSKEEEKQLKQAALNFASGLEKLAENYSGNNKTILVNAANDVKAAVNASGSNAQTISNEVATVRANLTQEMRNILSSGNP